METRSSRVYMSTIQFAYSNVNTVTFGMSHFAVYELVFHQITLLLMTVTQIRTNLSLCIIAFILMNLEPSKRQERHRRHYILV